jgi:hypothetical protein
MERKKVKGLLQLEREKMMPLWSESQKALQGQAQGQGQGLAALPEMFGSVASRREWDHQASGER